MSKNSTKVASPAKLAAKRAPARAANPHKSVARSAIPKPAKPTNPPKPKLLSGGNPQIAKADGDAPVQAYIAAMPGWKRDVGRRLDALIVRTVPGVRKAVRWNTPFYGVEGQGWFLGFHCITKYVKVAFFRGTSLRPLPPVESRQKDVRYLDIHEDDTLDEAHSRVGSSRHRNCRARICSDATAESTKKATTTMKKTKSGSKEGKGGTLPLS